MRLAPSSQHVPGHLLGTDRVIGAEPQHNVQTPAKYAFRCDFSLTLEFIIILRGNGCHRWCLSRRFGLKDVQLEYSRYILSDFFFLMQKELFIQNDLNIVS